jgi:hypothetical protein
MVFIRGLFIILLRELCSEVLKNLQKVDTQICVDRDEWKRGGTTDDADIADWGAHAARVLVLAASPKQSYLDLWCNERETTARRQICVICGTLVIPCRPRNSWCNHEVISARPPKPASEPRALPRSVISVLSAFTSYTREPQAIPAGGGLPLLPPPADLQA